MSRTPNEIRAERAAVKAELGASYNLWAKLKAAADKLDTARRKLADVEAEIGFSVDGFKAHREALQARLKQLDAEAVTAEADAVADAVEAGRRLSATLAEYERARQADRLQRETEERQRFLREADYNRGKAALEAIWPGLTEAQRANLVQYIGDAKLERGVSQEFAIAEWKNLPVDKQS